MFLIREHDGRRNVGNTSQAAVIPVPVSNFQLFPFVPP